MKKIELPVSLIELSEKFSRRGPLYITGGFVRNHIIGIPKDDMDLASYINPKEVIELLKGSDFQVVPVNVRLGTIKIIKGQESFEYTAFRRDNYPDNGAHRPMSVTFTKDIKCDAMRRDFTINAIYYNILKNEYIDFFQGFKDIANKTLRSTLEPDKVFSEDGLRIMRLARFMAELDFRIDDETYQSAKDNIGLLKDIAPERIQVELCKILSADTKYGLNKNAHIRGLEMLESLGAFKIIFPMLKLNHIDLLDNLDSETRLMALLINDCNSKDKISKSLDNLRYKKADIRAILRLKELLSIEVTLSNVLEIIVDNSDIIDKFSSLLAVFGRMREYKILQEKICLIRELNLPYNVGCLEVKGRDLIDLGVPENQRGEVLRKLLMGAIDNRLKNKMEQLAYLKEKII